MIPQFREDRATQVAARLLSLHRGKINHMKLIKLMYLVERGALVGWGRPITFDWLISMKNGPVLSSTLDCINAEAPESGETRSYWQTYISERSKNEIRLLVRKPPRDMLSDAEVALIDRVFAQFGKMDQWQLRDWCHTNLPEWKDPGPSRSHIELRDILRAERFSEPDIEEVLDAISEEKRVHALLQ